MGHLTHNSTLLTLLLPHMESELRDVECLRTPRGTELRGEKWEGTAGAEDPFGPVLFCSAPSILLLFGNSSETKERISYLHLIRSICVCFFLFVIIFEIGPPCLCCPFPPQPV